MLSVWTFSYHPIFFASVIRLIATSLLFKKGVAEPSGSKIKSISEVIHTSSSALDSSRILPDLSPSGILNRARCAHENRLGAPATINLMDTGKVQHGKGGRDRAQAVATVPPRTVTKGHEEATLPDLRTLTIHPPLIPDFGLFLLFFSRLMRVDAT